MQRSEQLHWRHHLRRRRNVRRRLLGHQCLLDRGLRHGRGVHGYLHRYGQLRRGRLVWRVGRRLRRVVQRQRQLRGQQRLRGRLRLRLALRRRLRLLRGPSSLPGWLQPDAGVLCCRRGLFSVPLSALARPLPKRIDVSPRLVEARVERAFHQMPAGLPAAELR